MALTAHDGGAGADMTSSRKVFEEILDLMVDALPRIPVDDGGRPGLMALIPQFASALGRPSVRRVM